MLEHMTRFMKIVDKIRGADNLGSLGPPSHELKSHRVFRAKTVPEPVVSI